MASRSGFDPASEIEGFSRGYRRLGSADRARGEKAYLKSPLRFHGVTVPQIRATAAAFVKDHPGLERRDLRSLIEGLFATEFHDLHTTGIAILEHERALLGATDRPWLIDLVRRSANWAHVDWLSTKVIGSVISRIPRRARARILESWARSPDLWTRRAALLAQLDELRAGRGDFALFETLAARMLEEREFFIRKAIGWVLRDVSKKRPDLVFDFLLRHRGKVSGLTFREGSRKLPASLRAGLERPVRTG